MGRTLELCLLERTEKALQDEPGHRVEKMRLTVTSTEVYEVTNSEEE